MIKAIQVGDKWYLALNPGTRTTEELTGEDGEREGSTYPVWDGLWSERKEWFQSPAHAMAFSSQQAANEHLSPKTLAAMATAPNRLW